MSDHYDECPRYFPRPKRRRRNQLARCPKCGQVWRCVLRGGGMEQWYVWEHDEKGTPIVISALRADNQRLREALERIEENHPPHKHTAKSVVTSRTCIICTARAALKEEG